MPLRLVIGILLLFLLGASSPSQEPVVRSRSVISTLPGEPCSESVEVCIPHWRSLLEKRGSIQVDLRDVHEGESSHVVIDNVTPDGPGDRAGLLVGDRVVAINENELEGKDHSNVIKILADFKVGQKVTYRIRRNGREQAISATASEPLPETINKWLFFCIAETFGVNAAKSFAKKQGVQFGHKGSRTP